MGLALWVAPRGRLGIFVLALSQASCASQILLRAQDSFRSPSEHIGGNFTRLLRTASKRLTFTQILQEVLVNTVAVSSAKNLRAPRIALPIGARNVHDLGDSRQKLILFKR
ncbi:hypothetical protein ROLI_031960 [Roseobacter fucihabitans]|uniref:Secreted protein n=1 Tax=Roseobacter fucihabitans TaxID=1537242 RepID=A0ABZ2BXA3_9RHOB|nr:hypothetical protein [Roseobacter litoralis]